LNIYDIERRSERSGNSYEWLWSFSPETTSSVPVGASIRTAWRVCLAWVSAQRRAGRSERNCSPSGQRWHRTIHGLTDRLV